MASYSWHSNLLGALSLSLFIIMIREKDPPFQVHTQGQVMWEPISRAAAFSKCTYMDTPRENTLWVMRSVNPFSEFRPEDRPWQEHIWRAVVCEGKLLWWLALLHPDIGITAPRTGKNVFSSFKSQNPWHLLWESGLTYTPFSAKSCVPHSARRDHVDLVEKSIYSYN